MTMTAAIVAGMPMHPLLVHIPVAFVPLAALGALIVAARRQWLATYGWIVAALAALAFAGSLLAVNTGDSLTDTLRASGQTISTRLRDHAQMGDRVPWVVGLFLVVTLAWLLVARRHPRTSEPRATVGIRTPRAAIAALAVATVLCGAAATTAVLVTGHSGASSVWDQP